MKWIIILSCLLGSSAIGQEINIGSVTNEVVLGPQAGNRDLAFGVKNILEEVIQDYGYDLNPNAETEIQVQILYFDVANTNLQIGVFGKQTDITKIIARATIYKNGKKKKSVNAKGTAKSISKSTLVVDQGGTFSQANVSTALKKLCEQLVNKLKL